MNPEAIAAEALGFTMLRPGQAAAITALAEGRDTVVVMPSAAGKSAIYQVAAIACGGPAVVVSPATASSRRPRRANGEGAPMGIIQSVASVLRARRRQPQDVAYGVALGHERFGPRELLDQAVEAERAGFDFVNGEKVLPELRG